MSIQFEIQFRFMALPAADGRLFDDLIRFVTRGGDDNFAAQAEEAIINSPVEDHRLTGIGELYARRRTRFAQRRAPSFVVKQTTFLKASPTIEIGVIEFALGAVWCLHRKDEL
jgi:hypothetical protein